MGADERRARSIAPPGGPAEEAIARAFLYGPGEMRARGRALDWAAGPLGPVSSWPSDLGVALQVVLAGTAPLALLWGPTLVWLPNDAMARLVGDGPAAFGASLDEAHPLLTAIAPHLATLRAGAAVVMVHGAPAGADEAPPRAVLVATPLHGVPAPTGRSYSRDDEPPGSPADAVRGHPSAPGAMRGVLVQQVQAAPPDGVDGARDAIVPLHRADARVAEMRRVLIHLAHELRTPLVSIGGYAHLLALGIFGALSPRQREAIGQLQAAKAMLLALVEDTLTYAEVGAGVVAHTPAAVALPALLEEVVGLLAPQAAQRGQVLSISVPLRPCVVRADRARLRQVLVNLVANAIKYTAPPDASGVVTGRIALVVGVPVPDDGSTLCIHVSDTGRGITPEAQALLFQPFVRIAAAPEATGTGLGLAISRGLVRAMGGELTVRSAVGVGSTFTVTLPRAAA
jgi:signal transduction histidine kinase